MKPADFLKTLWGDPPPGLVLTWQLAAKQSRYFKSSNAAGEAIRPTDCDVYTGVGLAHADHGKHRRIPNDRVVAISGFWADIDVNGGPDDKRGAAESKGEAIALAGALVEPTLIVDSGYGIQAWWLFDEPWRFKTYGEQRHAAKGAAQWQKLLRDQADFGLDYTHDLARILRIPGSLNAKGAERVAVELLSEGPRHERDELLELAAQAGDIDPGYSIGEVRQVDVSCRPDAQPAKLDELLRRSPAFGKVWRHERDDLPSMSEHDMALASIAALAGWDDQEIADLICHHRRARNPNDAKASRLDYVRRTVTKARATAVEDEAPAPKQQEAGSSHTPASWAQLIEAGLRSPDNDATELPWRALNEAMDGGLRPGEVCLVAGWTSHGKSIVVDQIADLAAEQDRKVHLYLTEMTAYQRGLRLLARKAGISFSKLKRRELQMPHWDKIRRVLDSMPYGCSIVSDWTVEEVVAHIRESKWDLAVVDLIHGFHYSDERDLSKTSSALVRAAKGSATADFAGTAILCAAHLNDGQMRDQRSARRPRPGLHSIKGSSSLKQDADSVIFVWREDDEQGLPMANGEVWIAKCRDGAINAGTDVALDPARMEFVERGGDLITLRGAA